MGVKALCISPAVLWNNDLLFTHLNNLPTIFSPYLNIFAQLVTEKNSKVIYLLLPNWNIWLEFIAFFPRKVYTPSLPQ